MLEEPAWQPLWQSFHPMLPLRSQVPAALPLTISIPNRQRGRSFRLPRHEWQCRRPERKVEAILRASGRGEISEGWAAHDALYLPPMRYPWLLVLASAAGCSLPAPKPPVAEFLVADGSSTYWVKSGPAGISSRTSPLILTSADSRFYEVYVEEVTRSYDDAVFSREPIYSRDLLSGKKRILYEDNKVTAWEKMYLTANPRARLLDPDEDANDNVSISATGESDILGVAGPYVLYDRHITLEKTDFEQSDSSRAAVDIRSGKTVPLNSLVRDTSVLGAGAVRDGNAVRWRHAGYDVIARFDTTRAETVVALRDLRGHEWPLGYVDSRLPRIFWLDQPRADVRLRAALNHAFEDARDHDEDAQFVSRMSGPLSRRAARLVSRRSESLTLRPHAISQ
jgi:hypothetical protein